jgi:hypothetical protein
VLRPLELKTFLKVGEWVSIAHLPLGLPVLITLSQALDLDFNQKNHIHLFCKGNHRIMCFVWLS